MTAPSFDQLRAEYAALMSAMTVSPDRSSTTVSATGAAA
jgi:hypothetical protein